MTPRPAGIKAVAARAGVSVGTVSNVLNRPDQVAKGTRRKVEEAIRELGFVRNASASTLKAGRSMTLGLVVLDIGNPFFTEVARGVEQAASERGYTVLLCNSAGTPSRQEAHLRFLEEQRVDGVLLTPVTEDSDRIERLRSRATAVVLVDEAGRGDCCSVAVDDVRGGQLAGEHLLATGRRRITYVTGPDSIRQCADRGRGLVEAVTAAGLDAHDTIRVLEVPELTGIEGRQSVERLLADGWSDAAFCANDVVALGVLGGLLSAGVRVPQDLALIGYDDIEFAATAAVPLTSIQQPAVQIGQTAAALVLDELTRRDEHAHQEVVFRPDLVIRRSTSS
ncbi:MAG: LacI family transcriptional regulator [Frankiales bacterium]|nr:LacI family transcriptional regulator [Frankiales bacterium]